LTNKVAPDYDTLELGIGDTVLFKALAEATGCKHCFLFFY